MLTLDVTGKPFSYATLQSALDVLGAEVDLPYDVPGGMASFRKTLALSFLFKFWNAVSVDLNIPLGAQDGLTPSAVQNPDDIMGGIHRAAGKGRRDNSVRTSCTSQRKVDSLTSYNTGSVRSGNLQKARTTSQRFGSGITR